jgi:hypothetical protein
MTTNPDARQPDEQWSPGTPPWKALEYDLHQLRLARGRGYSVGRGAYRQVLQNILEHCPDAPLGEPCSALRALAEAVAPLLDETEDPARTALRQLADVIGPLLPER